MAPAISANAIISAWSHTITSPATRRTYRAAVRTFTDVVALKVEADLYAVRPAKIHSYVEQLRENGRSSQTISVHLAALSSLYNHLIRRGRITTNPVTKVKRPIVATTGRKTTLALSKQQVRHVLSLPDTTTLHGRRDRLLLLIYFYTGCRLADAVNITVGDYVPGYIAGERWDSLTRLRLPNGDKREIEVPRELIEAIDAYLDWSDHGHLSAAKMIQPIRRRPIQDGISARQAARIFNKYAEMAKLPADITTHTARATYIATALEAGASAEIVQEAVGHRNISTTLRYDCNKYVPDGPIPNHVNYKPETKAEALYRRMFRPYHY